MTTTTGTQTTPTTRTRAQRLHRIRAVHEIHNLIGRHAFFSAAGHYDDLIGTFARRTPGVTVELADWGVYEGLDGARAALVGPLLEMARRNGEGMRAEYPELDVQDDRAGMLLESAFTTPVIQVAEDGGSARGVWMVMAAQTGFNPDAGRPEASWAWVHYAVDFVHEEDEENGVWRILRLRVVPRFRTAYDGSWVESSLRPQSPPPLSTTSDRPPTAPLNDYSVTRVPTYDPRPPEPYRTLDDLPPL
ncbi:nuclear transport factor 2 family protein [Streptomyces sp. NBC_01537]|uniref:nuclear transport factor 2 family protein n=1 Tax=Streptomyces sp. NBC_01537 TaxID=2903896 RepID=UPI00386DE1AA